VRTATVVMVLVSLVVTMTPGSAAAHAFGPGDNGVAFLDPNPVTFASDESNFDHHLFWNHYVYYQQQEYDGYTDLTVQEIARHWWDYSTDIVWFASPDVAPNWGEEVCRVMLDNGRCGRTRVKFLESLTRTHPNLPTFHLVCHEFGHAYGFGHLAHVGEGGGSCMANPKSDPWQSWTINGHMIDHINSVY
jgi:hypothetical protein